MARSPRKKVKFAVGDKVRHYHLHAGWLKGSVSAIDKDSGMLDILWDDRCQHRLDGLPAWKALQESHLPIQAVEKVELE